MRSFGCRPGPARCRHLAGPCGAWCTAAGVYLVPRPDALVIGATQHEVGHDVDVTVGGVRDLLADAEIVLPAIAEHALIAADAGLRPMTPRHLAAARPGGLPDRAGDRARPQRSASGPPDRRRRARRAGRPVPTRSSRHESTEVLVNVILNGQPKVVPDDCSSPALVRAMDHPAPSRSVRSSLRRSDGGRSPCSASWPDGCWWASGSP